MLSDMSNKIVSLHDVQRRHKFSMLQQWKWWRSITFIWKAAREV